MKKSICLFRGDKSQDFEGFHKLIKEVNNSILDKLNPEKLSYTISYRKPPAVSIIPFKKSLISVISIYSSSKHECEFLKDYQGFSGCYEVTEALPVAYELEWEKGEPTPGVCLLTLFRQKPSIDYDTFIDRWHNGHTPLSLKIHPLWHYNRNVVDKAIIEGPQWYDGIVEEHCKTASELFNPFKFFGKGFRIIPNMIKVYRDVNSFIDYSSIESYLVREYHLWRRVTGDGRRETRDGRRETRDGKREMTINTGMLIIISLNFWDINATLWCGLIVYRVLNPKPPIHESIQPIYLIILLILLFFIQPGNMGVRIFSRIECMHKQRHNRVLFQ